MHMGRSINTPVAWHLCTVLRGAAAAHTLCSDLRCLSRERTQPRVVLGTGMCWAKGCVGHRVVLGKGLCLAQACVWHRLVLATGWCMAQGRVWCRVMLGTGLYLEQGGVWHRGVLGTGLCGTCRAFYKKMLGQELTLDARAGSS